MGHVWGRLARALMASDDVEAVDPRHLAACAGFCAPRGNPSETSFKTSTTKGDIAAARQDHEKARVAYERALELRGRDVAVRVSLSRALLELGEIEAADKYLGKLHKAFPKTPIVNYLRAVSATQRGDLEEAKAALLSVLSAAPGHLESFFLLATIHYHEKNFEEAEASVQRVLDTVPDHLPSAKLLAALQVDQQRPEKAVEILNAVLPAAPDDVQLLALLGGAYMRAGEFDKANETLARAAKLAPDVASVRTQLALSQFGSGKSEQALAELSAASALNPEFAQADLLLIGVHLERGEYDEAVVAAQGFAEKQPANPMPHNLMGGAYEGLGDLAKARAAYHQALSLDPNFGAAVLNLARLELNEGNEDGARQRYDSVLAHTPHHPAVLSRLATLDFAAGDTNKAVERLEESRRHNPEDLSSRLSLAGWYLQTGKFAEAFPVAEEAFDLAPKLPQTITVLSRAELVNGKGESAIARLTALTKAYPESTEAFYQLAGTQIALGRTAAAAVSYNEVLRLDTEHAGATLGLGQVALLEGRFSDAIQTARLIQASHPESPEGYALEGDARFAGGNPKAAVKVYEAALQRASTTPLTIALSRAHKASGREDRATEVLLEWLKQHPDDLRVKAIRAESALVSGNRESAIETYEQIIAQAPDDVGVLNNLAYLYDQKNDPRALEFARKAYELAPAHPAIMDTYGWLLVRAGEVQRGLPILEESVAKSPENTEHRLHLGAALVTAGKTDKAREVLAALAGIEDEFPEKAEAQALLDLIE